MRTRIRERLYVCVYSKRTVIYAERILNARVRKYARARMCSPSAHIDSARTRISGYLYYVICVCVLRV